MGSLITKRTVLRAGYAAVISVLVLSAVEAYRIQAGVAQRHIEIYRRFVSEDAAITLLRRNLWLAGNDVRDFFIDTNAAHAELLRSQLQSLQEQNAATLAQLEPSFTTLVPRIRGGFEELWGVITPLPETSLHESDRRQYAFLQREVVPRRDHLHAELLDLGGAAQQDLQNAEAEFAASRRDGARRLLVLLVICVVLCAAVARASVRYGENQEQRALLHHREVEEARHELQQLSARLLEVEEEGRRRLSRELHDEIGQTLGLLQIEISHAQTMLSSQPAARESLRRVRELAESAVQTVRNVSRLLRPAILDDLGLVPALQSQLEDFIRRSGIGCDFVEENVSDHLADPVKTCVYRVVQEALHNCEKHAGAAKVRVTVRQLPECLIAEIEDDGCGFELNEQGKPVHNTGLGLLGIRERAALAGGSLRIDSAPRHGTRIALRVPLPPAPGPNQSSRNEVTA